MKTVNLGEILENMGYKNVLLHFTEAERISAIRTFHDALAKSGFFVTKQTQKMPEELDSIFEPAISNVQLFQKLG